MGLGRNYVGQHCALARALEVLGERWTLLIVRDAFYGVRRYGDFLAHLDIPRAVLAERLQVLVTAGVLVRQQYQDSPVREEYLLTEAGRELWGVVYPLAQWGERNLVETGAIRQFTHAACGTVIDRAGCCPRCGGDPLVPAEIEVRPGPGADQRRRPDPVSVALRGPHRLLEPLL